MTIDITIGKIKIKTLNNVIKEELDNYYTINSNNTFSLVNFLDIEQCPNENDGCTIDDTIYPNSAYRSGSICGMSDFFSDVMPDLIEKLRPIKSNDSQYTYIKPYIKEINKLQYNGDNKYNIKRLHWFKFWCNRAVELYGEKAVILFS